MPILTNYARAAGLRTDGKNPAIDNPSYGDYPWGSRRSVSGVTVTESTSLALTSVYRCIQLIASTAGGQPLHVYQENASGQGPAQLIKTDDTAYLWNRPNIEMSAPAFWETVFGHEVMGDAFIWVDKQPSGPAGIWYIEPERVRVGRTQSQIGQVPPYTKVYEVDNSLPMIDYRQGGEIIHVPNWSRAPLRGVNPIRVASVAIGLGLAADEYAARFFAQDSVPHGLLTSEQVLSQEDADRLAAEWERHNAGLANAHRTAVLGQGAKFQVLAVSPADAQLLEERRFQVSEIARLFGVPPHLVSDVTGSTSWGTGIEEQTLGFIQFNLMAHIRRFEAAINDALLVRELSDRYAKFNLDALMRGTTLKRYQSYVLGYGRWLTANDIRRWEELPEVVGGDDLLAMTNLVPLDELGVIAPPAQLPSGQP